MMNVRYYGTTLVLTGALLTSMTACPYSAKKRQEKQRMHLKVNSPAFADGALIPTLYTGQGDDHSPQLSWKGAPAGTKSFAIIVDDPDAPTGTWIHWIVFNIPGTIYSIAENTQVLGAIEGKNSWSEGRTIGYRGPMPPKGGGVHCYRFRVYALDIFLDLKRGATKDEVGNAMKGHVLAQGMLSGLYERR